MKSTKYDIKILSKNINGADFNGNMIADTTYAYRIVPAQDQLSCSFHIVTDTNISCYPASSVVFSCETVFEIQTPDIHYRPMLVDFMKLAGRSTKLITELFHKEFPPETVHLPSDRIFDFAQADAADHISKEIKEVFPDRKGTPHLY